MPLKPIKIKSRIESLIQDIKQADYAFDTFDAYYLALRLNDLYKNNKKVKKYLLELEKVITKEPESAYLYASNILNRAWPEAEPYIMKDPFLAYKYARLVLKKRWPEAEPTIKQKEVTWSLYKNLLLLNDISMNNTDKNE